MNILTTGSAPKDQFLQQKVVKAKDQLMGDRVDQLLLWKRKQESTDASGIMSNSQDEDDDHGGESDDDRNLPYDEVEEQKINKNAISDDEEDEDAELAQQGNSYPDRPQPSVN
jgi:hypothetical protein